LFYESTNCHIGSNDCSNATEDPKDKIELLKLSFLINYVLLIEPDSHTYDLQLHTYNLQNIITTYYYINIARTHTCNFQCS